MKSTYNKLSSIFILVAALLVSCREDDWSPAPDWNDNVGAATKVTVSSTHNRFVISEGIANEFIEFNLDVDGYGVTKVSAVELLLTYSQPAATPNRIVKGPLLLKTVSSFPAVVQVSAQEVAEFIGNGFTVNNFRNGDALQLTFPILTEDGRRLTVALNAELCVQPAQPLFGSCQVAWTVAN